MEAIYPEIILGSTISEKLKAIYHTDTHWSECYQEVAKMFSGLKTGARKFYSDKSELDILKELTRYSQDDIKEMYEGNL
jgi:hypothetical protein